MREVRTQQDLTAHEREDPAAGVVEPIDRPPGDILRHSLDPIVERPAVVAIEVALPLGEEIGNDGVEFAGLYARAQIGHEPSF
jgi:hypothetical protein